MTGYGSRFVAAGYEELKPFIKVEGKPIIEWITKGMYSSDDEFVFIVRQEHLDSIPGMEEQLKNMADNVNIYALDSWIKKGPVYDILRASDIIDDEEPYIINYCDFFMLWNWKEIRKALLERECDGAVPCYSGFHPHLLVDKNVYASCKTDNQDNLIEIREKYSFEKDKTKAKHSPGVYYFKTGKILKDYCKRLVDSEYEINGEYYASLPYNYMVADNRKVWVPVCVDKFCQWGTPEDMCESVYWIELFRRIMK